MECSSGKNCYTKNHIEEVRKSIYKERRQHLRIYQCSECFHYHLTSALDKSFKRKGSRPWSFSKESNKYPL